MKAIDWTDIQQKYAGKWVALEDDEVTVIASGDTPQEAWEAAQKKGYAMPILANMPDKIVPYVGAALNA